MRKPKSKPNGKWVFVPTKELSPIERELLENQEHDEIMEMLLVQRQLNPNNPFAAVEEFQNYFPGTNKLPESGAWVLVRDPPILNLQSRLYRSGSLNHGRCKMNDTAPTE